MTLSLRSTTGKFSLKPSSSDEKFYSFDIETNGLLNKGSKSVSKMWCMVIQDVVTKEIFKFIPDQLEEGLNKLKEADVLIGHNILFYDVPVIRKLFPKWEFAGQYIDTYVLSCLFYPKETLFALDEAIFPHLQKRDKGSHSLDAWGKRLKNYKQHFNDWTKFTPQMLEYNTQDVLVTTQLYEYLTSPSFTKKELEMSIPLEHDVAQILELQMATGWTFDVDAALDLEKELEQEQLKLEKEIISTIPPAIKEEVFVPKRDNRTRGYKAGVPFVKKKEIPFNPNSRDQCVRFFVEKYGWEPTEFTDNEENPKPKLNDEILATMPYPEAVPLGRYMMLQKRRGQISSGKNAWLKYVTDECKIHGSIIPNGTVTGRCAHCIEENQLVTQPKGYVPIKDVRVGDYVYSYDDNLEPQLNKVLEVIDQGVQECYKVKWRTNYMSKDGELICTQNHKVRTVEGWKKVSELKIGERVIHMTVTVDTSNGRKVLSFAGRKKKRQSTFIKEKLYKKFGNEWYIHHKDFNKLNDDVDNLELIKASDHIKLHSNLNPPGLIKLSKYSILRMIAKAKGHPTRVEMDFDTFKRKCREYNIDLNMVMARYSKATEKYITKRMIMTAVEEDWSPYKVGKTFSIKCDKKRYDKLLKSHGIIKNHWVYEIEYVGLRQTYDLSIANNHNFICQELCVSNSSPNLGQVPAARNPYGPECRALFSPPPGFVEIGSDAKALELRCLAGYLALYDGGEYIKKVVDPDVDIHVYNQNLFGVDTRDVAKTLIYCFPVECTKIKTENGWKTYDEIELNEGVHTYNMQTGMTEIQRIKSIINPYWDTVYRYRINDDFYFECTPLHRWVVQRHQFKELVPAELLSVGDKLLIDTERTSRRTTGKNRLVTINKIVREYLGRRLVFCIGTNNETFVMKQRNCPEMITGNCVVYGGGPRKAGSVIIPYGSVDEQFNVGKKALNRFMRELPAYAELKANVNEIVEARGFLRGLDGRKLNIRHNYAALNTLLQSAGAIIMKRVGVEIYEKLTAHGLVYHRDMVQLGYIHDEYQHGIVPEYVEDAKRLILESYQAAGRYCNFACPIEGDVKIGKNWAECH